MNIPTLELSKYLTKSTETLTSKLPTISYLVTPPTSPDPKDPIIVLQPTTTIPTNKRKLEDNNIPFIQEKKLKTESSNSQKLDLNLLDVYLSSGKSINVKDASYGLNLLCWACQCRSLEAVKKILQKGDIDINQRHGPHQITALHIAAAVDFSAGIDCLTEHPNLDLNVKDIYGLTAVHYAARHNKANSIKTLLEVGARSDLYDRHGRLAIHYAIRNSNVEIVNTILSMKGRNNPTFTNLVWSSINEHNCAMEEAIIMAVGNSTEMLKQLLISGSFLALESGGWWEEEYRHKLNELIELCVNWNRFECLRCLVVNTAIPLNRQALDLAVQQRKLDFVTYLCDHVGINPCHSNGNNPSLLYAANHGFMDMVPCLLTPDTSLDCIQQAILFTRMNGKYNIFHNILKNHSKSPTTTNTSSYSPLIYTNNK